MFLSCPESVRDIQNLLKRLDSRPIPICRDGNDGSIVEFVYRNYLGINQLISQTELNDYTIIRYNVTGFLLILNLGHVRDAERIVQFRSDNKGRISCL